jgi:hypothetical protein
MIIFTVTLKSVHLRVSTYWSSSAYNVSQNYICLFYSKKKNYICLSPHPGKITCTIYHADQCFAVLIAMFLFGKGSMCSNSILSSINVLPADQSLFMYIFYIYSARIYKNQKLCSDSEDIYNMLLPFSFRLGC